MSKKAFGVVTLGLCIVLLTAGIIFAFHGPQPVKDRLENNLPNGLAPAPVDGSSAEASPDGAPGPMSGRAEPTALLKRALKGRENNFVGEIRDWARQNPEAALSWAQNQPTNDEARREALTDACFQIAQTDPQRAVALAEQFHLDRGAVLTNLAQQWAAKDLASASAWTAQQTDDDQRNALATGLTLIWSKTDPAAAADFVAQRMTPGSEQDGAVLMVVHQWALLDPAGVAAWVRRFPEGPLRTTALNELGNLALHTP